MVIWADSVFRVSFSEHSLFGCVGTVRDDWEVLWEHRSLVGSGLGLSCLQLMEPSEVPGSVNGDVEV
ncbi:hypothetical protein AXFE_20270 [Acidithrix ferrooxidans]|uniref:Uncharacterized protein n=1 Tax=Acidithrix ferrooxidans TaxID=1280514 RepID=A0A0D8HGY8_9ACTN|nr:hypothetical protein AXFE_20270 [Acidithrix ferrooxidans]